MDKIFNSLKEIAKKRGIPVYRVTKNETLVYNEEFVDFLLEVISNPKILIIIEQKVKYINNEEGD